MEKTVPSPNNNTDFWTASRLLGSPNDPSQKTVLAHTHAAEIVSWKILRNSQRYASPYATLQISSYLHDLEIGL